MKNRTNKVLPVALIMVTLALNITLIQPVKAQTWTTNAPLLGARWGHAAMLLPNGLLLIAGGRIANDYTPPGNHANTNSCELYNPATGSSTLTGYLTYSHFAGISVLLNNGLELLAGGENNGQFPISGAELYDSGSGTWANTGSMNHIRESFAASLLPDGRVLVVGGYDGSGPGDLSSTEIYSPNTGVWTNAAPMGYPADSQTATLLPNGKVLVTGGSFNGNTLTNAILYNPANNIWANTGSMHTPHAGHVATLLPNGKVLVVGGGGSEEVYDPNSGTWTIVASMNTGRSYPTATLLPDGQVLVVGGDPGQTSTELYDSTNDVWTPTGSLHAGRLFHTATLVAQGQVVVAGGNAGTIGYYNGPPIADVETYNQVSSLGAALNTTNLVWNTGGDKNWFVETTNTHDSVSAAQSGAIADGQTTWIETTIPSDGQLSFYWKVSSEGNSDFLTFYISGNEQDAIADDVDWFQETYPVSAGDVLRWEYTKDAGNSVGLDAGFLDEVSYVVSTTPSLHVTALPLTGPSPLTVQFTSPGVDSAGNTVTNWHWTFGDGGSSTAQSPSHIYTNFNSYSPSLIAYSTYGTSPLNVTGPGTITVTNHTLDVTDNPQSGPFPLTVQFSSPGVDSGGNTVTNWNWTFGDGGTSTAQNPSHAYTTASTFSPSLVARSTYSSFPLDITGLSAITATNPPNPNFRTLYSFPATSGSSSTNGYGAGPNGGLVLIGNNLYGTTQHGGGNGVGTLFSVHTDGSSFVNWYDFSFANGAIPPDGVILSGGKFYGATYLGGTRSGGTIFAISTNGTDNTNLLNYNGNVDPNSGYEPQSGVVLADKTLYNTTWFGGAFNHGTISYVTTNGVSSGIFHHFSTPHGPDFNLNSDGLFPSSKLIFSNGTLYGTAEGGGNFASGTVFAVDTNNPGSFRILHYFTATTPQYTGTNTDGAFSFAGLVLSGNTLYGTTFGGGSFGYGTVFAVNTDGSGFTNLYSFTGTNGAYGPHSGLTLSGNTLYGTTSGGGSLGALSSGTLFAINTDGSGYRSLYSFSGGYDGAAPQGDLIVNNNTLYGTTAGGGSSGNGTVFSFTLPSSILLTNPIKSGGSFQFNFLNTSGSSNTVFATTNLTLPFSNWTLLGLAPEVSSGHFQFTDPQATNYPQRFYRVRSP
jgi:uncharacterized repeat protein (TIGR03803 family)